MTRTSFTHFGEAYVLNWLCKGIQPPKMNLWLALYTTDPGESGTGSEVASGGYARQQLVNITGSGTNVFGSITPNSGTGSICANNTIIEFPRATAAQGVITHIGILNAATNGDMIAHGELSDQKQIDTNDTFIFDTNELVIGMD